MSKRAKRRHELAKRKRRWLRITLRWWNLTKDGMLAPPYYISADLRRHWPNHARAVALRRSRTPAPCSCISCGNPRKWSGAVTRQERRSWADYRHQVQALGEEVSTLRVRKCTSKMHMEW